MDMCIHGLPHHLVEADITAWESPIFGTNTTWKTFRAPKDHSLALYIPWLTSEQEACCFYYIFFYFIIFIVVQVQLSAFSPSTPPQPQPSPPLSPDHNPLGFVHVSFIVVPENPSLSPPPIIPSHLLSGYCPCVLNFNVSGYILLACLFC